MKLFSCFALLVVLSGLTVQVSADIPPEPKPEPKTEGKAPWTAKEIRDYWSKGKVFSYDVETEDGKGSKGTMEIDNVTDADFTMMTTLQEAGKDAQSDKPRKRTFEEHLAGLEKQVKDATSEDATLTGSDGGTYNCKLLTMKKENGWQKYWLSREIAGLPVKMERETKNGEKRDYECWVLTDVDVLRVKLPWTTKEITEAWKDGAMLKLNIASEGGPGGWIMLTVTEANEEGFTSTESGEVEGKKHEGKPKKETWKRFMREMAGAKADTTITDETIKTIAGEFECACYTTTEKREGYEGVQKIWFAKKTPGLFVKMTVDGKRGEKVDQESWELTEYKYGK